VNCRNYRKIEQAKIAVCAWAKRHAVGCPVLKSGHTDSTPPVDRQHPHHCVIAVELGKPVVFPSGWVGRVGALQSVLNRQRARDHGASERRVVITRIGDNVLYPKGALTSVWCGMARAYAESPRLEASKYEIR
jgi:hypothetical protein